jgi:prophage DNA circulation protein
MSNFTDRLKTARYKSPSGQIILFDFEILSREGGKKVSLHELPFQDNGKIQQQGNTITKFPIVAYIYGKDYDLTADRFYNALEEKGIATLDHPRWGEKKVIPITYNQTENFVDNVRFATITIDFVIYTEQATPITKKEQLSKFATKLEAFKNTVSLDFLNKFDIRNLLEKSAAMQTFNTLLSSFENGLGAINQTKEEIKNQYDNILKSINRVDGLITDTEETINSIITLSFLGIGTDEKVGNITNAYLNTLNDYNATFIANSNREYLCSSNQLEVFGASNVGAVSSVILNYDFENKVEAINFLNNLDNLYQLFLNNQDNLQAKFKDTLLSDNYFLSNDTLLFLKELIAIAIEYVLNQLFDLKIEKKIIIDKETNPISLCYELYGDIEKLDALISDNDLKKYEMFIIPIGKEIKIYV